MYITVFKFDQLQGSHEQDQSRSNKISLFYISFTKTEPMKIGHLFGILFQKTVSFSIQDLGSETYNE